MKNKNIIGRMKESLSRNFLDLGILAVAFLGGGSVALQAEVAASPIIDTFVRNNPSIEPYIVPLVYFIVPIAVGLLSAGIAKLAMKRFDNS